MNCAHGEVKRTLGAIIGRSESKEIRGMAAGVI